MPADERWHPDVTGGSGCIVGASFVLEPHQGGENRSSQRNRTLKAGTISFGRAAGIDCLVRNVSETGACLEVESPVGIPDEADTIMQTC